MSDSGRKYLTVDSNRDRLEGIEDNRIINRPFIFYDNGSMFYLYLSRVRVQTFEIKGN